MGRKKFDSDQVFNDKCLKTKMKSYNNKITTIFPDKALKEGFECVYLSTIVINSVFKSSKSYYSHALLEEYKFKIREKLVKSFVENDLENKTEEELDFEEKSE